MENSPTRLFLVLCGLALLGACCFVAWVAQERVPTTQPRVGVTRAVLPLPPSKRWVAVPDLPAAARSVAIGYATAAFGAVAGTSNEAWIEEVAPWCSVAWLKHLETAVSGATVAKATVVATPVHVYPSWAPEGSVAATVLVQRAGELGSLYVELRLVDGRYLVEATE